MLNFLFDFPQFAEALLPRALLALLAVLRRAKLGVLRFPCGGIASASGSFASACGGIASADGGLATAGGR